jgi:hypothetical protein
MIRLVPTFAPVFALAAPLLLSGCVTYKVRNDGIARAALGETVYVNGPRVTPLEVLEDSRCPVGARCVWAGQVRLKVRIDLGARGEERELSSGKPEPVADGSLELVEVRPDRIAGETLDPNNYRFGFRFAGGL